MLPACLLGMQLPVVGHKFAFENSLKFYFCNQILRNLQRKNACRGFWRPGFPCNNNVTLVLLVMSLTLL